MTDYNTMADIIRESVSAIDTAEALGLEPDRQGRCACPFHNGHDRNLRLYPGNRGFYCFVCHEWGDSIKLARKLLPDFSFNETVQWFNTRFGLGLPIDGARPSVRERRRRAARYAKANSAGAQGSGPATAP